MNPENEIDKTEALEPVETAAANVAEARGGVDGRKRPKWLLPLIAVVCAVVLVVAGVVGWNMYRGAKLAEAKEACATAADGVRSQANEYNALLNEDAADAAADGDSRAAPSPATATAAPAVADARLVQRYVLAKLHAHPIVGGPGGAIAP